MSKYGSPEIEQLSQTDPTEIWQRLQRFTGRLAFDIGANCGQVARLLAPHFMRVIAVEPNHSAFERLQLGAEPNVTAVEGAVTEERLIDRYGTIKLDVNEAHASKGQFTTSEGFDVDGHGWGKVVGQVRCHAWTIQRLVVAYGEPDFIKIDTEGHEVHVVQGGIDYIKQYRPTLFIEVHRHDLGIALTPLLEPIYGDNAELVHHPHFAPGSWGFNNHYWLIAGGRE